jgi:death on curing protein
LPSEPAWLSAQVIADFNELAVADSGETFLVRDWGLLESAAARPINHWAYGEEDVAALAAALLLGIARNHPFEQGNKRTAFAAAEYFLYLNGYELAFPDGDDLADLIVNAVTGGIDDKQFAAALRDHVKP